MKRRSNVPRVSTNSSRVPARKDAVINATRTLLSICLVRLTTLKLKTRMARRTIQITKLGTAMTYQLSLSMKKISRILALLEAR